MTRLRPFAVLLLAVALFGTGCATLSPYTSREKIQQVEPGMTEKEVADMLGNPYDVNRTEYESFKTSQFVYRTSEYSRAYIHFEDYEVTSVSY
jgi:outer membrane protein assembly factor BamE (lipoprotein component of BamABCDE complex)